jgi:hypothetical protein
MSEVLTYAGLGYYPSSPKYVQVKMAADIKLTNLSGASVHLTLGEASELSASPFFKMLMSIIRERKGKEQRLVELCQSQPDSYGYRGTPRVLFGEQVYVRNNMVGVAIGSEARAYFQVCPWKRLS